MIDRKESSINEQYNELDRIIGALQLHLWDESVIKQLTHEDPIHNLRFRNLLAVIKNATVMKHKYSTPFGNIAQLLYVQDLQITESVIGFSEVCGAAYVINTRNRFFGGTSEDDPKITPLSHSFPYDNDGTLLLKAVLFKAPDYFNSLSIQETILLLTNGAIQSRGVGTTVHASRGEKGQLFIRQSQIINMQDFVQYSHWKPVVNTDEGIIVAKIPSVKEYIHLSLLGNNPISFQM